MSDPVPPTVRPDHDFAAFTSAVVRQAPTFIGLCDSELRPFFLNAAGREMVGLTAEADITRYTILDFFVAGDRETIERVGLPTMLREGHWERELCFCHFTDPSRQTEVRWSAFALRDDAGDLIGAATFTTDMSARRQAERALRDQQMLVSSLLENLPLGVGVYDRHGDLAHSNQRLRDYVGLGRLPSEDASSSQRWRSFEGDDEPIPPHRYPGARALRGESVVPGVDFLYEGDDAPERWLRVSAVPFRREDAEADEAIVVVQDIDDLKRAGAAISASEARFQGFADHSSNVIWIGDPAQATIIYRSPVYEQICGVPCEEAPKAFCECLKQVHADDRQQVEHAFATVGTGEVVQCEYRFIRPSDGAIRWLRDTIFPITDGNGVVTRIGGITEDLTDDEVRPIYIVSAKAVEARRLTRLARSLGYRVRTFESGSAFIDIAPVLAPGCVLVDLRKMREEGLAIPRELKARSVDLPTIALDAPGSDIAMAIAAMKAGAVDYLIVEDEASLRTALAGALADCHHAVKPTTRDENAGARIGKLTPREREVLLGLVSGGTNKTIGQKLGISPRTVELHRAQVMNRLNAGNLSELLQIALAAGMTPAADAKRKQRDGT